MKSTSTLSELRKDEMVAHIKAEISHDALARYVYDKLLCSGWAPTIECGTVHHCNKKPVHVSTAVIEELTCPF